MIGKHQTDMPIPATFFDLPADAVHVLILNAAEHRAWLEAGTSTLDMGEQERAARYVNPWHGRRFAYTRGLLRWLLGRFLKQAPAEIRFGYGAHGKPEMNAAAELHFNLSHCGDWVALAFSQGRQVGIDLESVAGCRDCLAVARQCFSPRELAELEQGMNAAQTFCAIWVRKEAVLKAAGRGLDSLQAFCTLDPDIALQDARGTLVKWHLSDVPTIAGYAMALAAEGGLVRNSIFCLGASSGSAETGKPFGDQMNAGWFASHGGKAGTKVYGMETCP